ncbi:MAG: nucleotide exchange factor GrpE [Thioalkalivibrionaceae bacterium]
MNRQDTSTEAQAQNGEHGEQHEGHEAVQGTAPETAESGARQGDLDATGEGEIDPAGLAAENAVLRDQLLRARADLENLRRRAERDVEHAHKYAAERFAEALLPICDSLEMGMTAAESGADVVKLVEGMRLTMDSFRQVFSRFGISEEDPTGERFDPERHQAMSMQEHSEQPANTVLQTLQKGYLLNGRVLRPAMVVVARAPAKRIDESV